MLHIKRLFYVQEQIHNQNERRVLSLLHYDYYNIDQILDHDISLLSVNQFVSVKYEIIIKVFCCRLKYFHFIIQ